MQYHNDLRLNSIIIVGLPIGLCHLTNLLHSGRWLTTMRTRGTLALWTRMTQTWGRGWWGHRPAVTSWSSRSVTHSSHSLSQQFSVTQTWGRGWWGHRPAVTSWSSRSVTHSSHSHSLSQQFSVTQTWARGWWGHRPAVTSWSCRSVTHSSHSHSLSQQFSVTQTWARGWWGHWMGLVCHTLLTLTLS